MITIRNNDWEQNLRAFVESKQRTRLRYGSHDCVQFTNGALKAMTGLDALKIGRIKAYSGKQGMKEMIAKHGGSLFEATDKILTSKPDKLAIEDKHVGLAVPGDIVGFLNTRGEEVLGVMWDHGTVVAAGAYGRVFLKTGTQVELERVWSV